jgi:hypothetical protein
LELLGGKPGSGRQVRADGRSSAIYLVAVNALRFCFKDDTASLAIACNRYHRRAWPSQTADVGYQLPDLVSAELREGRHCCASNARMDVLEDFAISVAAFQRASGEGGRPLGSARPRSVAALASRLVYRPASLDRVFAVGEGILLGLRKVLLCRETAKTKERPPETVSERWTNLPSHLNPRLAGICISLYHTPNCREIPVNADEFDILPGGQASLLQ